MKTKKSVKKNENYSTTSQQSETNHLDIENTVSHGSWNYSENIQEKINEENNKIKHETINFTF